MLEVVMCLQQQPTRHARVSAQRCYETTHQWHRDARTLSRRSVAIPSLPQCNLGIPACTSAYCIRNPEARGSGQQIDTSLAVTLLTPTMMVATRIHKRMKRTGADHDGGGTIRCYSRLLKPDNVPRCAETGKRFEVEFHKGSTDGNTTLAQLSSDAVRGRGGLSFPRPDFAFHSAVTHPVVRLAAGMPGR